MTTSGSPRATNATLAGMATNIASRNPWAYDFATSFMSPLAARSDSDGSAAVDKAITKIPLREVAEARGPVEVALSAGPELGQEASREGEIDVVDPDAEHHRSDATEHFAHARIAQVDDRAAEEPQTREGWPLGDDLEHPPGERADDEGLRAIHPVAGQHRRERQCGDEKGHVQERRGERGHDEAPHRMEGGHSQGRGADEEEIREQLPREGHGLLESPGSIVVAGGEELGQRAGEDHSQRGHDGQCAISDTPRSRCTKARRLVPFPRDLRAEHAGTTALDITPSPRSCRRALGIVHATKKASVSSPA